MINGIKQANLAAGFGRDPNHEMIISATEAEAAAIYTSESGCSKNDVIVVCDADGGKTDVYVFEMIDAAKVESRQGA